METSRGASVEIWGRRPETLITSTTVGTETTTEQSTAKTYATSPTPGSTTVGTETTTEQSTAKTYVTSPTPASTTAGTETTTEQSTAKTYATSPTPGSTTVGTETTTEQSTAKTYATSPTPGSTTVGTETTTEQSTAKTYVTSPTPASTTAGTETTTEQSTAKTYATSPTPASTTGGTETTTEQSTAKTYATSPTPASTTVGTETTTEQSTAKTYPTGTTPGTTTAGGFTTTVGTGTTTETTTGPSVPTETTTPPCVVEMYGAAYLSPVEEIFSSSNTEDAPKALTIAGWSPEPSDENPTLTIQLPKESPILKITADTRKASEVEVIVKDDKGNVPYSKTVKIGPDGSVEVLVPGIEGSTVEFVITPKPYKVPVVKNIIIKTCTEGTTLTSTTVKSSVGPFPTGTTEGTTTAGGISTTSLPLTTTETTTIVETTTPQCDVEMFGGGYLSPVEEIYSSSNPEDAPKALTIAGWSPEPSDKNPTLTATLPKESSILKITADIRKATKVEVVVKDDKGNVPFSKTVEIGPDGSVEVLVPGIDGSNVVFVITPKPMKEPVVKNVVIKTCTGGTTALTTGSTPASTSEVPTTVKTSVGPFPTGTTTEGTTMAGGFTTTSLPISTGTTTGPSVSTTATICDHTEALDYDSPYLEVKVSDASDNTVPKDALLGSNSYWSPASDKSTIIFQIKSLDDTAQFYVVSFKTVNVKKVVISVLDSNGDTVTSEKPDTNNPGQVSNVAVDFNGAEGVMISIEVIKMKNSYEPAKLYDLSLEACFHPGFIESTTGTLTATTPKETASTTPSLTVHTEMTTQITTTLEVTTECEKLSLRDLTSDMVSVETQDSAPSSNPNDVFTGYWVAKPRTKNPEIIVKLEDAANSPMVYEVILTVENVVQIEAVLYDANNDFVKSVTKEPKPSGADTIVLLFNGAIGPKIVLTFTSLQYGEPAIVSGLTIVACIHPKELTPSSTTTKLTTTTEPVCVFTQEVFRDYFGYEQIDKLGYVEKDGKEGLTRQSEIIKIDSVIEAGVVVFVGCSNCTCMSDGSISCETGQCEGCKYTEWSEWTDCSKECDVGCRSRDRIKLTITNPNICAEDIKEIEDCNIAPCITTTTTPMCEQWSDWSECSSPEACTQGIRTRDRHCPGSPAMENEPCVNNCTIPDCKEPLVLITEPRCDITCYNVQYPQSCVDVEGFEPSCGCKEGYVIDESSGICIPIGQCQKCYKEDGTPVNPGFSYMKSHCEECICTEGLTFTCSIQSDCCEWSDWGSWGECSETCKEGVQNKYRVLLAGEPKECGDDKMTQECEPPSPLPEECVDCVYKDEEYRFGDLLEIQDNGCVKCYCDSTHESYCIKDPLSSVNGSWSGWSEWSVCSSSCDGGIRSRTRSCSDPIPLCDGHFCGGKNEEVETCNADLPCCITTDWSDWSECSTTCEEGEIVRMRAFEDPSEQNACPDVKVVDIQPCDLGECICQYTDWSEWTECDKECGIGLSQRKRDLEGPNYSQECENSQMEERDCYLDDCECDKDHQQWSNHSHCMTTCLDRFTTIPIEDCEELNPGCICEDGYFEDQNGNCVENEDCSVCYHPDKPSVPIQPGQIFKNPNVACEMCECVGGEIICNRRCEFPACKEGEVLSYPRTDPCCPKCIPEETTCKVQTVKKVVKSGDCETTEEINFTYCSGSCGNSTSMPMLIRDDSSDDPMLESSCKCCTATKLLGFKTVEMRCGLPYQRFTRKAKIAVIGKCECDSCMQTEYAKNQEDASKNFKQ